MSDHAIFCKTFRDDFGRLQGLIESYERHSSLIPFLISVPAQDLALLRRDVRLPRNCSIVADEDYVPRAAASLHGWLHQQVCKLSVHRLNWASSYFMVDSDAYFVSALTDDDFVEIDRPRFFFSLLSTVMHEGNDSLVGYVQAGDSELGRERYRQRQGGSLEGAHERLSALRRWLATARDPDSIELLGKIPPVFLSPASAVCQPGQVFHSLYLREMEEFFCAGGLTFAELIVMAPWEYNWYAHWVAAAKSDQAVPVQSLQLHFPNAAAMKFAHAHGLREADFAKVFRTIQMAARHFDDHRYIDPDLRPSSVVRGPTAFSNSSKAPPRESLSGARMVGNPGELDGIGRNSGIDRSSLHHDYLKIYESLFTPMRSQRLTILEFGAIPDLRSLRMWAQFFPKATLVGVFEDPAMRQTLGENIVIEIGRQGDHGFLLELAQKYRPDVIFDDGPHKWTDQITCLQIMFPIVSVGGYYIVEDMQTNFGSDIPVYSDGAVISPYGYLEQLARGVILESATGLPGDEFATYFVRAAESLSFLKRLCIIRKRPTPSFEFFRIIEAERATGRLFPVDNGGAYKRQTAPLARVEAAPAALEQEFERQRRVEIVVPPGGYVGCFENALVHEPGIVSTEVGELLLDSLPNQPWLHRFYGFYRYAGGRIAVLESGDAEARCLDDAPYVLLDQEWGENYGHWLVECLPRVALVAEAMPLGECKFIVPAAGAKMEAVYADALALLHIEKDRILFSSRELLRVPKLVFASPITRGPWILSPRSIESLEELGASAMASHALLQRGPERLFVSRNRAERGNRKLTNESELELMPAVRGFVTVYPEQLSLYEQIAVFSNARIVVGVLGAALTNLAFAPRGVRLLALTTEFMQDDFYFDLVCHKNGIYYSLHGRAKEPEKGMQSDFCVDLSVFEAMLEQLQAV